MLWGVDATMFADYSLIEKAARTEFGRVAASIAMIRLEAVT
jgi:hypothetical protein